MDSSKASLPSNSTNYEYEEKVKQVRNHVVLSKRLMHFLALTFILNAILTYGLIFHPPPPSDRLCAKFIEKNYPQLVHASGKVIRSIETSSQNDLFRPETTPTTDLAIRSTGKIYAVNRWHRINFDDVLIYFQGS